MTTESPVERGRGGKLEKSCTILVQKLSTTDPHEWKGVGKLLAQLERVESPIYTKCFPCSSISMLLESESVLAFPLLKSVLQTKDVRVDWLSTALSTPNSSNDHALPHP